MKDCVWSCYETLLFDGAFIYNPGHNILRHLDV